MKNFIGVGNRVTLTAAAVTTSGQPVLIGSLFGIAERDRKSTRLNSSHRP